MCWEDVTPLIVGSGATVAEQLIHLIDETGIDGFNLTRTVAPESHQDFIRWVIPELQQRGRYKTAYSEGTLRHKLFQQGNLLSAQHPVQQFRCLTPGLSRRNPSYSKTACIKHFKNF